MTRTVWKALGTAAALLAAAGIAWAACSTCTYNRRGNRSEGVLAQKISGGSFDLLAVEYRPAGGLPASGKDVHLYFWLPKPETPVIEVREPDTSYWMVPDRKPYAQGLQAFTWPRRDVLDPLGLATSVLSPKVSDPLKTLYYPAYLSAGQKPAPDGGYVFSFRSGAGIDVRGAIVPNGRTVPVRKFTYREGYGGRLRINWNGRDDAGKPVPRGVYVLRLDGNMMAESIRPLNFRLSFVHYGQLQ
jgi:hypothetical protein